MAEGEYEAALPVALDAVQQGGALFKPGPALQMFPLYLLAAQANLGLRRAQQCSDALCLAGLLALKDPGLTTSLMRSQLARLNGQLAALQVGLLLGGSALACFACRPLDCLLMLPRVGFLGKLMVQPTTNRSPTTPPMQGKTQEALTYFAQDVYYCALDYGPRDVRTSLGYFNLCKVLQGGGDGGSQNMQGALACADMVVDIWRAALAPLVLGPEFAADETEETAGCSGGAAAASTSSSSAISLGRGAVTTAAAPVAALAQLPVGPLQLLEVVDMLQDVARLRGRERGPGHPSIGEAQQVAALALLYVGEPARFVVTDDGVHWAVCF
jgi:hypothetical protein